MRGNAVFGETGHDFTILDILKIKSMTQSSRKHKPMWGEKKPVHPPLAPFIVSTCACTECLFD